MLPIPKNILEVNPDCQVTVQHVGRDRSKVLLADNFYHYPDRMAELALTLYYTEAQPLAGSYPGARALVTLDTRPLVKTLSVLWGEPLEPYHAAYHPVIFGAIIQREYQLSVWQRQPHIDPGVTMMVYLNPEELCAGGTGLYRHRPTGLERLPIAVTPELARIAAQHGVSVSTLKDDPWSNERYAEFLNTVILNPRYAAPGNEYINDGNEFWELLHLVEMRPNRMVIFDARIPHSQYIKSDQYRTCYRITQIMYFKGHD